MVQTETKIQVSAFSSTQDFDLNSGYGCELAAWNKSRIVNAYLR
jgi:hypothetical protein